MERAMAYRARLGRVTQTHRCTAHVRQSAVQHWTGRLWAGVAAMRADERAHTSRSCARGRKTETALDFACAEKAHARFHDPFLE